MKKTILNIVVAALFTLSAYSVTFEWDPSPDKNVTGYRVYWNTSTNVIGGVGSTNKPVVAPITNITFVNSNFLANVPYYFVVTAVNTANLESLPSNMVTWTNLVAPSAPKNFRVLLVP